MFSCWPSTVEDKLYRKLDVCDTSNSNNKEKTLSSSMYVCVYVDKQT